jgi:cyclase
MLRKRIIVCLDIMDGRVIVGAPPEAPRLAGDPVELAAHFAREGADEIMFLDASSAAEGRRLLLDAVRRTAEQLFIPLTVGGAVSEMGDVALLLRAGADRVVINTAAIGHPELVTEAVQRFGSQCIVAGIDARLERRQIEILSRPEDAHADVAGAAPPATWFRVFTQSGAAATQLDAIVWARQCAELGAGEILITSIDAEGRRTGYDLELTARVVEAVSVPVIAGGSVGDVAHLRDAFLLAGADAACASRIFLDGTTTVAAVKRLLSDAGLQMRAPEPSPELNEQPLT